MLLMMLMMLVMISRSRRSNSYAAYLHCGDAAVLTVDLTYSRCPSPRHYIVDPMLFPSGNPVKNAMRRFRS